jgi:hypothetical protein
MLELKNRTQIGTPSSDIYDFDYLETVEIRSSWDTLTDTAKMTLPKKITYKNEFGFETTRITGKKDIINRPFSEAPVFVQGDSVKLSGGYGDDVPLIFSGFIRAIASNHPIKFFYEDAMYFLKNNFIEEYSEKNVTLLQIVEFITKDIKEIDIKLNVVDGIVFDEYVIDNATAAKVLKDIASKYNLFSWFRDGVLNVGLAYLLKDIDKVKIHRFIGSGEDCNIINTDALEYKTDDQVQIQLEVTSTSQNNTAKTVTVGNVINGEKHTKKITGIKDGLETIAANILGKQVFEGFTGSFETFLLPLVKHGDAVKLTDPEFLEREGIYLVKEVVYSYGVDGGRQKITLDEKIG